jgi:hypothetical protein
MVRGLRCLLKPRRAAGITDMTPNYLPPDSAAFECADVMSEGEDRLARAREVAQRIEHACRHVLGDAATDSPPPSDNSCNAEHRIG